jgi:hypothetical protein
MLSDTRRYVFAEFREPYKVISSPYQHEQKYGQKILRGQQPTIRREKHSHAQRGAALAVGAQQASMPVIGWLGSGIFDVLFYYQEHKASLIRIQREGLLGEMTTNCQLDCGLVMGNLEGRRLEGAGFARFTRRYPVSGGRSTALELTSVSLVPH